MRPALWYTFSILNVAACSGQTNSQGSCGDSQVHVGTPRFMWGQPPSAVRRAKLDCLYRQRCQTETLPSSHMRAVVQRVSRAKVSVNDEITGKISLGLVVLLGVGRDDTNADATYLVEKIAGLRVFEDAHGKMNLSVKDIGGSVLAVSQFTLYGDVRRGKRPSFDAAAPPEKARQLYEFFVDQIRAAGLRCETGRFQEMMQVELVNEGPVTILLDSAKGF